MIEPTLLIAFFGMVVLVLAFVAALAMLLIRPWLQCFLSGRPVPAFEIVAMRLRGAPVQKICEQRIKAGSVGVDLSPAQLEKAHRQGADIEKMVDALCLAKRTEREVTWEDLLATEST